jgi:hypothetical protein
MPRNSTSILKPHQKGLGCPKWASPVQAHRSFRPIPLDTETTLPPYQSSPGMESELLQSFCAAVDRTTVLEDPFTHFLIENPFPPQIYEAVLRNLPESKYYKELRHRDAIQSDGTSSRLEFGLNEKNIEILPASQRVFWQTIGKVLRSRVLEFSVRRLLDAGLAYRFGDRRNRLCLNPTPLLTRDVTGYKI